MSLGTDAYPPLPATERDDFITAALSCWLMGGLYLDAYHHKHVQVIESIFTPAHAVLYAGFAVLTLWLLTMVGDRQADGRRWVEAIPHGYGWGMIGAVIFMVSSATDLVWHSFFGFEKSFDAVLSPTHLGIFVGITLIITCPWRAAEIRLRRQGESLFHFLPATVALTLVSGLWALDLGYLMIFLFPLPASAVGKTAEALGIARLLLSGVVLTVPMLLLLRRWRPPFGVVTLLFSGVAGVVAFTGHIFPIWPFLAGLVAGIVVDVLVQVLRPASDRRWAMRVCAAAAPSIVVATHIGFAATRYTLGWHFNILGGTTIVAGLTGVALELLIEPHGEPVAPQTI